MLFRRKKETMKSRLLGERSKKVLFIAHCLLNENTRYMGELSARESILKF